ncbi:MAG TPA: hypothetical protein VGR76_18635 [Candidatus Angelobacter sp.]|nr:hypothetical protein [Candidatus Angelobacter sp.]
MKRFMAAFLMLALAAPRGVYGRQQPADEWQQGPSASLPVAPAAGTAPQGPQTAGARDHVLLRRNTPVCLRPSHDLSGKNAKAGDHLTFRLHGDVSAEGLIVAADGATVSATVTEAKKSAWLLRDGKLTFRFDPLLLATGEPVPLMTHVITEHVPGHSVGYVEGNLFAIPLIPIVVPFLKGDEATVTENQCVDLAIANDVSLGKAEIIRKQPQSGSWKARLQQLILRDGAPLTALPPGAGRPIQSGNNIMELDLISGNERRLGKCHHCYSPAACPDCFLPGGGRYQIVFLQANGIYAMWADSIHDVKHGSQLRISVRTFSRIVGVLGSDLAMLDAGPQACRIVLLGTTSGPVELLDQMDCDEVAPGYAQQARTGTSAWLDSNHLLYVRE